VAQETHEPEPESDPESEPVEEPDSASEPDSVSVATMSERITELEAELVAAEEAEEAPAAQEMDA
jgi:hypothetical protein